MRSFVCMKSTALALFAFVAAQSCIPDLYLIDRQTVMEMDASGDWPELDKEIFESHRQAGPVALKKDERKSERKVVYATVDGDYSEEQKKSK